MNKPKRVKRKYKKIINRRLTSDEYNLKYLDQMVVCERATNNPNLSTLMKRLRLIPNSLYMSQNKNFCDKWIDGARSIFSIEKMKVQIKYNILGEEVHNLDMYANVNITEAITLSSVGFYIVGEYEYILLLGEDNYYRTYMKYEDIFIRIPNLYLGFSVLKYIDNRSGEKLYWCDEVIGKTYFEENTFKVCMMTIEQLENKFNAQ